MVRWPVIEYEGLPLSCLDAELRHGFHVLARELYRRGEFQGIRARRHQQHLVAAPHPRDDGAVVEAHHQFHAQRDAAAHAFDDAHDVPAFIRERHIVDQPHAALVGVDVGLEDEAVVAIAAADAQHRPRRRDQPPPMLRPPQERGEAGRRIEARKAQPVDGAVLANQGGGVTIADHGVVLYRQGHRFSSRESCVQTCAWDGV